MAVPPQSETNGAPHRTPRSNQGQRYWDRGRLTLDDLGACRPRRGLWERAYFAIEKSQELIQTNRDLRNDSKRIVKKSKLLLGWRVV